MERNSAFETELRKVFTNKHPKYIIETGTWLGRGTSSMIWDAIVNNGITDFKFTTIEVNPSHYEEAVKYFKLKGMNINAKNGLSIPRTKLLSKIDIETQFVDSSIYGIYYDHNPLTRGESYYKETNFIVKDDLLGETMEEYNYKLDFLLLDSAGHLGWIEFQHILPMIKQKCIIMLDDVNHCKHYKTLQFIHSDNRFNVLLSHPEQFGFSIVEFAP